MYVVTVLWSLPSNAARSKRDFVECTTQQARTLQPGKEVAEFRVLSKAHKIKGDMQKMNREQFFIVLSTDHQAEL